MEWVVLGDLHLVRESKPAVIASLATVFAEHPRARIVFAGDLFDLSADQAGHPAGVALARAFAEQPIFVELVREHVRHGGEVWFTSGNHDAALGDPEHRDVVDRALALDEAGRARVRTSPWFLTEGDVHVEHGHLYDPDNAPAHPLVFGTRCLGVHFVEEFIAPTGATRYLNANDETPLKLLLSAFRWYGVRGPYVVYRYFYTAFTAMLASGPFFRGHAERHTGEAREAAFATLHDVPAEALGGLRALGAIPTMQSFGRTFSRIYFDRVLSTTALLLGLATFKKRSISRPLLAAGAATMIASWAMGHDRYGGTVPEILKRAGVRVAEATDKLVVLGHAHRETLEGRYANTGSFAFPGTSPGRPYVVVRDAGGRARAEHRHAPL